MAEERLTPTFIREAIVQYRGPRWSARPAITRPPEAVAFARRLVQDQAREHFLVLYLDGRHRAIAHAMNSVGTANTSLVHPREIFQIAVLTGAAAFLVLHNHPSGDPTPSRDDHAVTQRLAQAGEMMGIALVDSVVFSHEDGGFVSLRERHPELFPPAHRDLQLKQGSGPRRSAIS